MMEILCQETVALFDTFVPGTFLTLPWNLNPKIFDLDGIGMSDNNQKKPISCQLFTNQLSLYLQ